MATQKKAQRSLTFTLENIHGSQRVTSKVDLLSVAFWYLTSSMNSRLQKLEKMDFVSKGVQAIPQRCYGVVVAVTATTTITQSMLKSHLLNNLPNSCNFQGKNYLKFLIAAPP